MREIGNGLWVHEAPLSVLGVPAGRRMAVVRLADGGLLVHSAAPLDSELRPQLDALGRVRFVVPASLLHGHVSMGDYRKAYPEAALFSAPGLARRRKDLRFDGELGAAPDPRWADVLDQTMFEGIRGVREIVFLHRASRSLLVGDVVWNVGPELGVRARLWAGWRRGVRPTPALRLSVGDRAAARASMERVLAWDFDRIVIGHGAMVETGGREAFRDAWGFVGR